MLHGHVLGDRGRHTTIDAVEWLIGGHWDIVVNHIGDFRFTTREVDEVFVFEGTAGIVVRLIPLGRVALQSVFRQHVADAVVCICHILDEDCRGLHADLCQSGVCPICGYLNACGDITALGSLYFTADTEGLAAAAVVGVDGFATVDPTTGITVGIQLIVVQNHRVTITTAVNSQGNHVVSIYLI